jgi:hypothetical protein
VRPAAGRSREQAYQAYLAFLNSSFLQLAAGSTHDLLNERGLWVGNERGDRIRVGGDDTLLSQSGQLGAQVAGEAAARSRRAIEDTLRTGRAADDVAAIWALFPTFVYDGRTPVPLADWQDGVLHDLCRREIFPDVVDSAKSKVVRGASPELSGAGIELGGAPAPGPVVPAPGDLGDWVVGPGAGRRG